MLALQAYFGVKSLAKLGTAIQDSGYEEIPVIAFHGLKEGARKMGEPFDYTMEEVTDWIDDEPSGIFQDILGAFNEDFMATQKGDEEEKKETPKAKTQK